jgi:hypothetical protein
MPVSPTPDAPPASPISPDIAEAIGGGADIAAYAGQLADLHGVELKDNDLDRFATAASRLSDAQVEPDKTADLLVALYRAGVISNRENMALYDAHLRQTSADAAFARTPVPDPTDMENRHG